MQALVDVCVDGLGVDVVEGFGDDCDAGKKRSASSEARLYEVVCDGFSDGYEEVQEFVDVCVDSPNEDVVESMTKPHVYRDWYNDMLTI